MLTEEAFCPHESPSGLKHGNNYDLALVAALMYAKRINLAKYSEVLKQYTSTTRSEAPTHQDRDAEDDSNVPQAKRSKAVASTASFRETFYHFLLGKLTSTNTNDILVWQPKEHLHKVLGATITAAIGIFDTQLTLSCQQ